MPGSDATPLEGALRYATEEHLEFWSRAAYQQYETPDAVVVAVTLNDNQRWIGTGIAMQGDEHGSARVVLDRPLAPSDRRKNPRYDVEWPVTIMLDNGATLTGRTVDASIGGFQFFPDDVAACRRLLEGEWVAAAMTFTRRDVGSSFIGLAVVRAALPTAWRFQFSELPQRMTDQLNDALREHAKRLAGTRAAVDRSPGTAGARRVTIRARSGPNAAGRTARNR
jgi:PilZ domain